MLILKPSKIANAGVGLFTTRPIKSGEYIPMFAASDHRFVEDPEQEEVFLVKRFGIRDPRGGWHIPADWHRMSIGWYINHSDNPNVAHDDYIYYAHKYIRAGEELTINYESLLLRGP